MLSGLGQSPAHADASDRDAECSSGAAAYLCVTFPTPGQDGKVVLIGRDELYDAAGDCASCDVHAKNGDYRSRSQKGSPENLDAFTGISLATLTSFASNGAVTAADVTFIQVNQTVHASRYISVVDNGDGQAELATPAPFQGNFPPAVYFTNNPRSANVGYARPLRNDDDVNDADNFEVGTGNFQQQNFVHVTVHTTGKVLHPTITAASEPEKQGSKTVTLTAGVPDANGTALSYVWDCDGGTLANDASGASVACTYTSATGAAYPSVVVTGADTSYGYARLEDAITVDPVGGGGGGGGGGGNGGKTDPSGGAKTGSGTKSGGVPTKAAGSGDRPGSGAGTTEPAGSGGNGPGASGAATPRTGGPGTPFPGATERARGTGELVQGLLLIAPQGAVQAAGPSESPGQARAPVARRLSTSHLDLRQLWWLVPIGLIAFGVFAERRRPRRQGSRV